MEMIWKWPWSDQCITLALSRNAEEKGRKKQEGKKERKKSIANAEAEI
jgi:hypothetical protein